MNVVICRATRGKPAPTVSMDKSGPFKLLVIDDDAESLALISATLKGHDREIFTAQDPKIGFETFLRVRPKIVLHGSLMPSTQGLELLERIMQIDPGANVILISGHYTPELALEAIQKGACHYLKKPLDLKSLRDRVESLTVEAEVRQRTLNLDHELVDACRFEGIVSRSPLMLDVFAKIRRVAPYFKTALVTGATGTGKELVARALHRLSNALRERFVVCNCSALVESLAESELFGYVKGAFTGANQDRPGLFESADGGTLFLDEIGELSPGTQAKLLRVLQDHRVRRVGSTSSGLVDVRVIAATNRDLRAMVSAGTFREDLYYRLAVVEIPVPSLENRRDDLPLLQRYFVEKFALEYQKPIGGLTRRAQARMATYSWPGNIRELENVIGNACMMAEGRFIDIKDLPERLREAQRDDSRADETLLSLQEAQRRHIMRVLDRVGGNKLQAARILGVGRTTIYKVLSRNKLEGQEPYHRSAQ